MGRHAKIKVKEIEVRLRRRLRDWDAFQNIPNFLFDSLTYPWLPVGLDERWPFIPLDDETFVRFAYGRAKAHAFHRKIDPRTDPTLQEIRAGDVKTVLIDWDTLQRDERHSATPLNMSLEERCKSFVFGKWLDCALDMDVESDFYSLLPDPFDMEGLSNEERAEVAAKIENDRAHMTQAASEREGPLPATSGDVRAFVMDQTNADSNSVASQMPKKLVEGGWVERIAHPTDGRSYYLVPKTSKKEEAAKFLVPGRADRVQKNYLHLQAVEAFEYEILTHALLRAVDAPKDAVSQFLHESFDLNTGKALEQWAGAVGQTVKEFLSGTKDGAPALHITGERYDKPNIFIEYIENAVDELMRAPETLPPEEEVLKQTDKYKVVGYYDD